MVQPILPPRSPASVIDEHLASLREISHKLLLENEKLRRREFDLTKEIASVKKARDAFADQCKQLSDLIGELRDENAAREGTR